MIKVFLVEDERIIRESIQKMIPWEEFGFELTGEATDGEMALPVIRSSKPDVIITDIKMPFMDGLTLSTLVKKEMPETKIIILSGYDDFSYAQKAISIGVEQYLLKPISKNKFIEVLKALQTKFETENAQKDYYQKFLGEIQEYEKHSRQLFFEEMVSGQVELQKIYEDAEKNKIDILAQAYNIVLFTMNGKERNTTTDSYSQTVADVQQQLNEIFVNQPDYMLFRNQMFSYALLVRCDADQIEDKTRECVDKLREIFTEGGKNMDWFVCSARPVERLSSLPECYQEAANAFAMRYLENNRHILTSESVQEKGVESQKETLPLNKIDVNVIKPEVISNFLANGLREEIHEFVENYIKMIGEEALRSMMFRQYIILNIHFNTIAFIEKLGYTKEKMGTENVGQLTSRIQSREEVVSTVAEILDKAITLRDENSQKRYQNLMETAVSFIQKNYSDENLSLNKVACVANVSANHFSALFSQEMQQTFIEYLTALRMKKAKELLRCTDKRSGEIALEVGYKDAHYFSFLFKKTQGCTPSDYRNRKAEGRS